MCTQPVPTWRVHVHVFIEALKVLRVQLVVNARHVWRVALMQTGPVNTIKEGVRLNLLQWLKRGEWV
jgi:hypothetical protein